MKVKEIIKDSALVNDETRIQIVYNNTVLATGNWFNDEVLSYQDKEVNSVEYHAGMNQLTIRVWM